MATFRMQISEDAYKFLQGEPLSADPDGTWRNVRGVDGSMARVGRTESEDQFGRWKDRLDAGKFEYVIPDE